jgi:hypothetical protein
MAKSKTTFTKDAPSKKPRGKSFKNKLLDTIAAQSLLNVKKGATKEEIEQAYLSHAAGRAFDPDDAASPTLLKTLLDKSYAGIKSTMPTFNFEFDADSEPMEQANQIIKAASDGMIPPDIAVIFIQCIKSCSDIEEFTELKARIEALEKALSGES